MGLSTTKTRLVTFVLLWLPALALAQGARVQGRLLDEQGQPIEGATVTVANETLGARHTATTDAKGRWAVLGLEGGSWDVDFEAEGYVTEKISLPVSALSNPRPIEIRLGRGGPPPELLEAAEKGDAALEAGRFAEARQHYETLLARRPEMAATLHVRIARSYKEEGNVEREIEHLQAGLDADPGNHGVRTLLAMELLEKGEVERAVALLDAVDESQVSRPDVFYNIGVSFLNQGRREDAIEYFTKAVELDPAYADGYLQRGLAYLGLQALERAEKDFERVVELDADGPQAKTAARVLEHIRSESP
jgi:tetratricopeptide (TPR) repeat protein